MTHVNDSAGEWVAVARLLRPQGRRGELLAEPLTDVSGLLGAGAELRITASEADPQPSTTSVVLESAWVPTGRNAGRVVLKLRGCDDISDAERYAGKQLLLAADQLPALEADTFYVRDLLGCTLWNEGQPVGEIVDVQFVTTTDGKQRLEDAAPLLEVRPRDAPEDDTVLVPFVRTFLLGVDTAAQRVDTRLPEGLLQSPDLGTDALN